MSISLLEVGAGLTGILGDELIETGVIRLAS